MKSEASEVGVVFPSVQHWGAPTIGRERDPGLLVEEVVAEAQVHGYVPQCVSAWRDGFIGVAEVACAVSSCTGQSTAHP